VDLNIHVINNSYLVSLIKSSLQLFNEINGRTEGLYVATSMAIIMSSGNHILFREEQKFNQLWFWVLVLIPASIYWYAVIEQLVFKRTFGTNPASDSGAVLI
jgi:hypothetical protein